MADISKSLLFDKATGLHTGRRSGILVVTQDDITKGLFFRAGHIVFASSTVEKDKLGENLIRLGRISRADFAAAYQSQGPKKRLGQVLVGAGLMTEEDLGRAVSLQIQKIVISVFTWTRGEARFHESPDPIPTDLAVELSTHRLLLEGARVFPDVARLEKALGDLERQLRIAVRPPFEYTRLGLSPAEESVLRDAADGHRISEMLSRSQPRPLLVRAVYALSVGGILEEPKAGEAGLPEEDTGTFRLALAAAPPAPPVPTAVPTPPARAARPAQPAPPAGPPLEQVRERLLKLYESIPRATHYEVLAVPPNASEAVILAAHNRQEEEQERDFSRVKGESRLASMISTLRLRQRESYRILSDPTRRANYDRTLGGLKPAAAPVVSERAQTDAAEATKEARELLEHGQRDAAITLLLQAVAKNPRDLESRRMLALTLSGHPTLARSAERHFLAALELSPRDTDMRFALGQYYRKAGLRRRAIAQFQTVLEADPGNRPAKKVLDKLLAEDA